MGQGEEIKDKAIEGGKNYIKKAKKKILLAIFTNPLIYIIIFLFFIIMIVISDDIDSSGSSSGNSGGMSSAAGSGTGSTAGTAVAEIDVYNDDGTVNEEKIQELQLILETNYNLVPGSLAGNNIGGEYNKESCEKVTGTYLGFSHWDESSIPRSKLGGIVYQCPWWANGRASEVNGKEIKISGNAKDMYANAQSTYNVGSTPKKNSLVVYDHGEYGHVAYIEAVDEINGCYYISHAGSGQSWFGIQKISSFTGAPWDGYTLIGFVYVGEPKDSTV